jgi:chromosome condensin MukBEF complex kleisin-like MukF subunit
LDTKKRIKPISLASENAGSILRTHPFLFSMSNPLTSDDTKEILRLLNTTLVKVGDLQESMEELRESAVTHEELQILKKEIIDQMFCLDKQGRLNIVETINRQTSPLKSGLEDHKHRIIAIEKTLKLAL